LAGGVFLEGGNISQGSGGVCVFRGGEGIDQKGRRLTHTGDDKKLDLRAGGGPKQSSRTGIKIGEKKNTNKTEKGGKKRRLTRCPESKKKKPQKKTKKTDFSPVKEQPRVMVGVPRNSPRKRKKNGGKRLSGQSRNKKNQNKQP